MYSGYPILKRKIAGKSALFATFFAIFHLKSGSSVSNDAVAVPGPIRVKNMTTESRPDSVCSPQFLS